MNFVVFVCALLQYNFIIIISLITIKFIELDHCMHINAKLQ